MTFVHDPLYVSQVVASPEPVFEPVPEPLSQSAMVIEKPMDMKANDVEVPVIEKPVEEKEPVVA